MYSEDDILSAFGFEDISEMTEGQMADYLAGLEQGFPFDDWEEVEDE